MRDVGALILIDNRMVHQCLSLAGRHARPVVCQCHAHAGGRGSESPNTHVRCDSGPPPLPLGRSGRPSCQRRRSGVWCCAYRLPYVFRDELGHVWFL